MDDVISLVKQFSETARIFSLGIFKKIYIYSLGINHSYVQFDSKKVWVATHPAIFWRESLELGTKRLSSLHSRKDSETN